MNAAASRSDLALGAIHAPGGAGTVAPGRMDDAFDALIGRHLGRSVLSESSNAGVADLGLFADEARGRNAEAARKRLTTAGSDGQESPDRATSAPDVTESAPVGEPVHSQRQGDRPIERQPDDRPADQPQHAPVASRTPAPVQRRDESQSPTPAAASDAQYRPTGAHASAAGAPTARTTAGGGSSAATGAVRVVTSTGAAVGVHGSGSNRAQFSGRLTAPHNSRPSIWKPEHAEFSRQLERGIQAALRQQGGSVTMRLRPDALGDLRIHLDLNGTDVSAMFDVREESARRLLEESVDQLRSALEARGLRVGRIEFASSEQGDARPAHDAPNERREASTGGAGQHEQRAAQDAPHRESRDGPDQDAGRTGPSARTPRDDWSQPETGTLDGWRVSALGGAGVGSHIVMRIDTLA